MGWKDAPVVESGPAWASAPEVGEAAAPAPAPTPAPADGGGFRFRPDVGRPSAFGEGRERVAGLLRGGKDILDTGAHALAWLWDAATGGSQAPRVAAIKEAGKQELAGGY